MVIIAFIWFVNSSQRCMKGNEHGLEIIKMNKRADNFLLQCPHRSLVSRFPCGGLNSFNMFA